MTQTEKDEVWNEAIETAASRCDAMIQQTVNAHDKPIGERGQHIVGLLLAYSALIRTLKRPVQQTDYTPIDLDAKPLWRTDEDRPDAESYREERYTERRGDDDV